MFGAERRMGIKYMVNNGMRFPAFQLLETPPSVGNAVEIANFIQLKTLKSIVYVSA